MCRSSPAGADDPVLPHPHVHLGVFRHRRKISLLSPNSNYRKQKDMKTATCEVRIRFLTRSEADDSHLNPTSPDARQNSKNCFRVSGEKPRGPFPVCSTLSRPIELGLSLGNRLAWRRTGSSTSSCPGDGLSTIMSQLQVGDTIWAMSFKICVRHQGLLGWASLLRLACHLHDTSRSSTSTPSQTLDLCRQSPSLKWTRGIWDHPNANPTWPNPNRRTRRLGQSQDLHLTQPLAGPKQQSREQHLISIFRPILAWPFPQHCIPAPHSPPTWRGGF